MKHTRFPFDKIIWVTFLFLSITNVVSITLVPWWLWHFGIDTFQAAMFSFLFVATGMSITLGYHRLFSHRAFEASLPVRFFVLAFGAASFESSALWWASSHRRHHKHVDQDDDPYDINKGFFWAHIGWLLFKLRPEPPINNVRDLERDPLIMFQHRHVNLLATIMGFGLPTLIGALWYGTVQGAVASFLISGALRIVAVQHATFFINSLCHTIGSRPYCSRTSARDSWLMAVFTFGEGYHNFHHTFQHDYRNGVKPWHFDPTKWAIWTLSKLSLARNLRTVPDSKILLAQLREAEHRTSHQLALLSSLPDLPDLSLEYQQLYEAFARQSQRLQVLIIQLESQLSEQLDLSLDFARRCRRTLWLNTRYLLAARHLA